MPSGDLKKHTLNLRAGDWDYLESLYHPHGLSVSTVVRTLVSNYVDKKRSEETEPDMTELKDLKI